MAGTGKTSSQIVTKEAGLAAAKERDLYSWATRQAALLREGRIAEIDAAAIAEEIDDVGEGSINQPRAAAPGRLRFASREGERTVSCEKTPGLKARLSEAMSEAYEDARDEAAKETGLPTRTFPVEIPFTFSDAMERPVLWPGDEA